MRTFSAEEIAQLDGKPFWPALRSESGQSLIERIRLHWQSVLDDPGSSEGEIHSFLATNAGLFFAPPVFESIVLSKLRLGRDHEVDLVVCSDQRSYGLQYHLIELETPHEEAYTQGGNPTARLTHAVQQTMDWQQWLAANVEEAKRLFPSKMSLLWKKPSLQFTVIIGRRENGKRWRDRRNAYSTQLGIPIRSFDWLTDQLHLRTKYFPAIVGTLDGTGTPLPIQSLHDLACPFVQAYTDAEWAKIRSDPAFERMTHMVESNAELLLRHRRLSPYYEEFKELQSKIPASEMQALRTSFARY